MRFHDQAVWLLFLCVLLPLVWRNVLRRTRRPAILFSSIEPLRLLPAGWAARAHFILPVLRTLAMLVLIICLARPQEANEQTRIYSEGVAIQLLVDRSGSMAALDFRIGDQSADRLSAVKKVVREFVQGEEEFPGRPDDLIGLIVYGTYPDSLCPLTLDHDFLIETLSRVEVARSNDESATAIGDAIALGVERLRSLPDERNFAPAHKIKSKIIVLLTDGENTAGDIEPVEAAKMAAASEIKIYTIGAGSTGVAPMPVRDARGREFIQHVRVDIDEETLKEIAKTTDGQYFRATDTDSLKKIYARIDELEKTQIEERQYTQYKELATSAFDWGGMTFPPLLLIVLVLLSLEILLSNTRLRMLP